MILGLLVGITMGFELGTVDNVYSSVGVMLVGVIVVG
jgi:putative effector of murein hydrolase